MSDHPASEFRCGLVAIVGRPNVGKSTLLNKLVGQKISITSKKAQTTRHRVMGIRTEDDAQFVFVDTPGFQTRHTSTMNRAMNKRVRETLSDTDVVMMLVEAGRLTREDKQVMELLPTDRPVILVVNKIDYAKDKAALMAYLQEIAAVRAFTEIVPVSAKNAHNLDELLTQISECSKSLYRLDDRSRTYWWIGMEWIFDIRNSVLADTKIVQHKIIFKKTCKLSLLDRLIRNCVLCHTTLLGRFHTTFYVEGIYRRRCIALSQFPRNSSSDITYV